MADETREVVTEFTEMIDLAADRVGAVAIAASDDFFAGIEHLVKSARPIFIEDKYTDRGKWMDGWESRRSFGRVAGHTHDWCIVKLGLPGVLHGFDVDTSYFRGNFPEACSIEACELNADASVEQLTRASVPWVEVLPKTPLQGHAQNLLHAPRTVHDGVEVERSRFTHLRLNIFPDGGVARLRVYGEVLPDWTRLLCLGSAIDLASVESGGVVVTCNDMFFGSRHNLIMPGRAQHMGDGWETKRKRQPGHDWVIVKLGARGVIKGVEVDTNHFKGNFPESCLLEGTWAEVAVTPSELVSPQRQWRELLPRTKLRGHTRHVFCNELANIGPITHVRMSIFPDGGVSRLCLFGVPVGKDGT
ncbi:MAG: allantoicase [Polyangiales bacterium]